MASTPKPLAGTLRDKRRNPSGTQPVCALSPYNPILAMPISLPQFGFGRARVAIVATAAALSASAFAAGAARAQTAGGASASSLDQTDQAYFKKNAQGSVYDLTLAQLGVLRGQTARTRDYARMVTTDHARLNIMMLQLANRERMYDLPLTLDAEDNSRLQRLMGLSGAEFDKAFADEEVRINAEDVEDSQKELSATKSAPVRRVVQTFHATESKHLAGARALQGK